MIPAFGISDSPVYEQGERKYQGVQESRDHKISGGSPSGYFSSGYTAEGYQRMTT
jgi:hypothetical protein